MNERIGAGSLLNGYTYADPWDVTNPLCGSIGSRFASFTEGQPGVDGSPGPSERNWTLPRWMADSGRKGPLG